MAFALGVLAAGIGAVGYWHRKADARHELSRRTVPSSFLGKVSLWLLVAGLLYGPLSRVEGPVAVTFLDGLIPLALAAFAFTVVAFAKYHDRGLLLLVPFAVGVVFIVALVAVFATGGSSARSFGRYDASASAIIGSASRAADSPRAMSSRASEKSH